MTEHSRADARQLALEVATERFAALIPAAVRKAAIECVADLADDARPHREVLRTYQLDALDELDIEAFDAALDDFTEHLKKTLLLDPTPWMTPRSIIRTNRAGSYPDSAFSPRAYYSQNREDYS